MTLVAGRPVIPEPAARRKAARSLGYARPMRLLTGFTLLLALQIAGEAVVRLTALPVPGPVVGLLLLLGALVALPALEPRVADASGALLSHLSLLFVPAGVGVVVHLARLEGAVLGVAVTLALSTLAGLAVTALVLQRLLRGAVPER